MYEAIANEKQKLYGVQFHPEVDLTPNGKVMLKNFLYDVCGLNGTFTMQSRERECVEYIRKTVGNCKVLVCFFFCLFIRLILFKYLIDVSQWRC